MFALIICYITLGDHTFPLDDLFLHQYTLQSEYRVVGNRYSRMVFTSKYELCANVRVQEQSTNMTSQ